MTYLLAIVVLFLVVAACVHHYLICEVGHEAKITQLSARGMCTRLDALQDNVASLRQEFAAKDDADATVMADAARAALVDALICAVDSLSYVRETDEGKDQTLAAERTDATK